MVKEFYSTVIRIKRQLMINPCLLNSQGYGFAEVEQLYGLETIRNAADQLKNLYGGKGKMRLKLFISIKGIKLFEYSTMVSAIQATQRSTAIVNNLVTMEFPDSENKV